MSVITVSRKLSAPVAKVWEVLSDFGGVHTWSAGVEESPINDGTPTSGVGSERNCQLYDGNHIQERVTQSIELKQLSIEIFETSMPMKRAEAVFALSPAPGGGTDVKVTMDYTVKYGPIGAAMDVLMMRRMMTGTFNNLLASLDHHVTTGEAIGKGWKPLAKVA